jgi:hypothetical protein
MGKEKFKCKDMDRDRGRDKDRTGTGTGPGVPEISLPNSTYFESGHPVIFYVHCPTVKRNVASSQ